MTAGNRPRVAASESGNFQLAEIDWRIWLMESSWLRRARGFMGKSFTAISVLASALALSQSNALAADLSATDPAQFEPESAWEVSVSPFYLWLLGFKGTVGAGANSSKINITPIDLYVDNFGNFIDALDGLYMGTGEIRNGDIGFYYDVIYADLLTGQSLSNNLVQANVDVGFSLALATLMGTYRVYETETAHLDAMAGLRVSSVELSIGASLNRNAIGNARAKSTWVDPALGFSFGYDYSENLALKGWAIVGGFGAGSDFMWDVFGGAEYFFNDEFSAFLGFRGGGTDYKSSSLVYDVTNWGPMVGVGLKLGPSGSTASSEPARDLMVDWSGAYAGIGLGYYGGVDQMNTSPFNLLTGLPVPLSNRTYYARARGFAGGGFAGYNFHIPDGPIVLGIEGDLYGTTAEDTAGSAIFLGGPAGMRVKGENEVAWSARGRLGYASGAFMPYLTGGYAGLSARSSVTIFQGTSQTKSKTNTYGGWTFGGGLDFMMSPNMVLGAEFRHANYGAKTNVFNFPGIGALPSGTGVTVRTKIYDNQILFRGAYRF